MKLLTTLLVLITSVCSYSQMLTFDQAQNLRKKSLADVEAFLTARKWEMTEAQEATDEKMGKVVFGYDISQFDSEKAASWVSFMPSKLGGEYNRLSIQVNKPALYTAFMTRLTANGYKLKSSGIVDGGIKKVYTATSTTCVVTTSTVEGVYTKSTSYSFFFINTTSYKLNYEDE